MKLLILLFLSLSCLAQQQTFTDNCTTYYTNRCYSHGGNMVKRSVKNKKLFLKSKGYIKCPKEYEIDHIIPLSKGGTDCPNNMQLLTVQEHRKKTAKERIKKPNQ
jgi:5-methylcytosine-specific restriction endonuclease McrA